VNSPAPRSGEREFGGSYNRLVRWLITAEIVVLAILVLFAEWRWGAVAWFIAIVFAAAPIAAAFWRREQLKNVLTLLGGALAVLAMALAIAYHTRFREQSRTMASMRRIAAALAREAESHRGLYPDGAHFATVVRRAGIPFNDAWGHPFRYTAIDRIGLPTGLGAGPGFILQSAGADGIWKPNYIGDVYNWPRTVLGLRDSGNDLLMINGVFVQGLRSAWQ